MLDSSCQIDKSGPRAGVLMVDEFDRILLTPRNRPPEVRCWSLDLTITFRNAIPAFSRVR